MKSNWELTKSNSNYHFDSRRVDGPQQVVQFLGHITPTWSADLENIVTDAKPATWATRGYKTEHSVVPSAELEKEEYDLVASGMGRDLPITHFNWQIPASLQRISDSFALPVLLAPKPEPEIVSIDPLPAFDVVGEYKGAKSTFNHGDILKSASWRAPAKNFARGQ